MTNMVILEICVLVLDIPHIFSCNGLGKLDVHVYNCYIINHSVRLMRDRPRTVPRKRRGLCPSCRRRLTDWKVEC